MKITGILLLVFACAGAGLSAAGRLAEAQRLWQAWEMLLSRLEAELRYAVCPVQEILSRLDKAEYRALGWLDEYESGTPLHCPKKLAAEERAFARAFFAFLGASDLEGQLAHIARFRQQAADAARLAAERCRRLSGVYTAVGVCGGLCVGLVML